MGHDRDTNSGPLPADWVALGDAIRAIREDKANLTLRAAAKKADIASSSLSRYELGQSRIPVNAASRLDVALGAEGWIAFSAARLHQPIWSPWIDQAAATSHAHKWPAPFGGQVWVHVVPVPQRARQTHDLNLWWGPWRQRLLLDLPVTGICLVTGKAPDDGPPVTFELQSTHAVFAFYGVHDPLARDVVDIRSGWWRN